MTTPNMIGASAPVGAGAPSSSAGSDQLRTAAKQFEAIFLRQMIGAMRSASLSEDILSSGATDQFRDMADARTADSMAEKSAIGIADLLLRQLAPPRTEPGATGSITTAPVTGSLK